MSTNRAELAVTEEESREFEGERGIKRATKLFRLMAKKEASDLHLKAKRPPMLRVDGEVRALKLPPLSPVAINEMSLSLMDDHQRVHFEERGNVDFGYQVDETLRVRVNVFRQRGSTSMAARLVKSTIPNFQELHLPDAITKIPDARQGLVLVCGITGSGKSTTLGAMLQHINMRRRCHILTIEDPIEYLYRDEKAFVNQREMGVDVQDWPEALRAAVRQDPDVIMVGEMRDPDTFSAGLSAAETGHLVLGTLHASNSPQAIGRIVDMFPGERQDLIRQSLAFNLSAIICQKLLPSCAENVGVVPAVEVLLTNPTVRKMIREGRDRQLAEAIRACQEEGMQDFTQSIAKLIEDGLVEVRVGVENAPQPEELRMLLRGIQLRHPGIVG